MVLGFKKKSLTGTVPPMSYHDSKLYDLSIYELRTICNHRKGKSCRDSNGKYLPKSQLIELIIQEPDVIPQLPPRNKPKTKPKAKPLRNLRPKVKTIDKDGYLIPGCLRDTDEQGYVIPGCLRK